MAGALFRRNTIIILMCLELMFNSVNLLLAAFSAHHSDPVRPGLRVLHHARGRRGSDRGPRASW